MRYDSGQFQSFDGLDNRKEVMRMLGLLGSDERRGKFLKSLIGGSRTGLRGAMMHVTDCDTVSAYHLFTAITGCLGVDINEAAKKLEREVRRI